MAGLDDDDHPDYVLDLVDDAVPAPADPVLPG